MHLVTIHIDDFLVFETEIDTEEHAAEYLLEVVGKGFPYHEDGKTVMFPPHRIHHVTVSPELPTNFIPKLVIQGIY